ncbi:isochorismate synthase [Microbacterium ulmi]|uniref:isochorismate synthase n=1 Tax=Microbacterium ulmi TaxID=179095 RepID=A0A7Y2PYP1_9MICO|nr:isochorismate synthase [Microbacterium ulmi]NII68759.1 menaquinone-specific isochorismate synthase [Microbacterium ulmi]NNH03581.1 chorismate-binding protein [Microbacterium ulmi]
MTDPPRPPRLVAETREVDAIDDLLLHTSADTPLAWLRRGDGIVGLGRPVLSIPRGGDMPAAPGGTTWPTHSELWRLFAGAAEIDDDVRLPGTGLVAFGAFTFDPRSERSSLLTVPPLIVGRRDGRSWVTRIRSLGAVVADERPAFASTPYGPYWSGTLGPGALDAEGYVDAVRQGLAAISAGELDKVVLARDVVGTVPAGADLRRLARALSTDYPDTWTFAVDGLVGASPETLVTVSDGTVTARVLAGTIPRGTDAGDDVAASDTLAHSGKNLDEHRYAVRSVVDALAPFTSELRADTEPFTLELPNLWHLATDVEGDLLDHASALDLVAALHPTAAVAGTPTDVAIEVIRRIEPFDRGRYAGPVGWVDANGDGEWAIALRCAQIGAPPARRFAAYSDTIPVTAHAGAGIVAGSDPDAELIETRVKFRPIVDALA